MILAELSCPSTPALDFCTARRRPRGMRGHFAGRVLKVIWGRADSTERPRRSDLDGPHLLKNIFTRKTRSDVGDDEGLILLWLVRHLRWGVTRDVQRPPPFLGDWHCVC